MAKHLSKNLKTVTMAGVCAMCAAMADMAAGQGMTDPTRPPDIVSEPEGAKGSASAAPQVQSILISPTRRVATIDGRTVGVGDRVGDARVTKIQENEVVLGTGKEQRVLKLFPGIEKQPATSRKAAKTGNGAQ